MPICYGSWRLVIYKIHGVLVMERNDQVSPNHKNVADGHTGKVTLIRTV